jgi:hypothetical protein
VVLQVFAPGDEVTVYPVTAAPPLATGAAHATTEAVLRFELATTAVGAPGTVEGVADGEAADSTEVPLTFLDVTVNV